MPQNYANRLGFPFPPRTATAPPVLDNSETIAMLQRWAREDATDDPAAIAQAEYELAEFKAALNANRSPGKPVFP
jgi:hypothetical protein